MKMENEVNEYDHIDVWVYLKSKEEELRVEKTVGIGTSQFCE